MLLLGLAGPITVNQLAAATGPGFAVNIPHWAANGGWSSSWSVLKASGNPLSCTLDLVGPVGQVLSLNTSVGNGNSLPFNVAQGGRAIIQAGGAGSSVLG